MKLGRSGISHRFAFFTLFALLLQLPGYGVTTTWNNGGKTGRWSNPTNWSSGTVPAPGDAVVFDATSTSNCLADMVSNNLAAITLDTGYTGAVTFASNAVAGGMSLTVSGDIIVNAGNLVFMGNPTNINDINGGTVGNPYGIGYAISAANVTIAANASINANGQGFIWQSGPGAGAGSASTWVGAGGGYGGKGGDAFLSGYPLQQGGPTYGSATAPTALGSGGGSCQHGAKYGGEGGGAIKLSVSGTIMVNGTVAANGRTGYHTSYAGGGSGGSVWIIAGTFAGTGMVSAVGGAVAGGTSSPGGGGGGGRIRVKYNAKTFNGTVTANGGAGGYQAGEAGQVTEIDTGIPQSPPNTPILSMPADAATGTSQRPFFEFSATDANYDYIGYKIEIATNPGFTENLRTIDQTLSQTGWRYQTENGRTAYASGETARYELQSPSLLSDTTYYWRVNAIDPAGSNTWSAASVTRSFTTVASTTIIWINNTDDGLWSTADNWSKSAAPVAGDNVVFNFTCTDACTANSVSNSLGSITLTAGYTNTVTFKTNAVAGGMSLNVTGDITVLSGNLVFMGNPTNINGGAATNPYGIGYAISAANVTIAANASINANGQGFIWQSGPGAGAGSASTWVGAGGGYGGSGGDALERGYPLQHGGSTYGSAASPTALGSGGGSVLHGAYSGANGGKGGGAIKLSVSGTITVNGILSADGATGLHTSHAGGGSGGSIWIVQGILAGTGIISANGGNVQEGTAGSGPGGGGGGGRIDISGTTNNFTGSLQVLGGRGYQRRGFTGSILLPQSSGTGLTLDNFVPTQNITIGHGITLGSVIINSNVTLTIDANTDDSIYDFTALTVNSGGNVVCLGNQNEVNADSGGTTNNPYGAGLIISAANITIAANASINANGQGFIWQNGPGAGQGSVSTYTGAGGGYGGKGGDSFFSGYPLQQGGPTYGSATAPTALGSGGGSCMHGAQYGGEGGGAITLSVSGTIMVNGTVAANGLTGHHTSYAGGGSGGSVWIITGTFAGTGMVSAVGGAVAGTSPPGGGGGGGRIAVWHGVPQTLRAKILSREFNVKFCVYSTPENTGFSGAVSVTNGIGWSSVPPACAYPGTKVFMTVKPAGTLFIIK